MKIKKGTKKYKLWIETLLSPSQVVERVKKEKLKCKFTTADVSRLRKNGLKVATEHLRKYLYEWADVLEHLKK